MVNGTDNNYCVNYIGATLEVIQTNLISITFITLASNR